MFAQIENGKPELVEVLKNTILTHGPIPFSEWMEQVLYHPDHGYYASGQAIIGRKGNFFTSVSVGPLFGEILARQFSEMWNQLGRPTSWHLCEQGAHDAQLMVDVLSWLENYQPEMFQSCTCTIIEPSSSLESLQYAHLKERGFHSKCQWIPNIQNLPLVPIIFYSNELVDSFPCAQVKFSNGKWNEMYVGWNVKNQTFEWIFSFPSQQLIKEIEKLQLPKIEDYTAEISIYAKNWIQALAGAMRSGYILTIDYGFLQEHLYSFDRPQGTLSCYYDHTRSNDPFKYVGFQDITSHVNFSDLIETGKTHGLKTIEFTDQHRWIVKLISEYLLQLERDHKSETVERLRALKTLMHPEMMGSAFKVLIQQK
jgi:SAM-dependent MidA family methyltransferase